MIFAPRRMIACTAIGLVTSTSAGCGLSLESLPLTGPGAATDSYTVKAIFANALNLPAKAKVRLNGADIGQVDTISAHDFSADVTMSIRSDVRLPRTITIELRSATPLGDLFVAVKPDPKQTPGTPLLKDGDVIPVGSTDGGATVEEVLSSAALLVNGGVIKNMTTLLNGAGAAVGGRGTNVRSLLDQSNVLISRLATRSAGIRTAMQKTADLADALSARQTTINTALAAAAPATSVVAENISQIADITDTVGRITGQLSRFPSLQGTDTRSLIADLNKLSAAFNDIATDPNLSLMPLNQLLPIILKSFGSTAIRGTAEVVKLALGALPDKNYPGDPMFHGPDGTDWHAMVGSLRYEWNLLLGKIYGPRP
ncbi:virulence factor Mce family protein [Mycobacterium sp. 283mftsu]|nr:virulence factor Mce family protein [Mycobacterium sp. 283mftsu]